MPISIVTAFFDIGRGDWASRPNTPAWLARSTEDYFACFERMCRLENEIVVFTESQFADRIYAARAKLGYSAQTKVVVKNPFEEHADDLATITRIIQQPNFLAGVTHPHCPEYWEPRYVLINHLKSTFVCEALDAGLATHDFAAWIDFAYCRDDATLPKSLKWDYPFSDRIHLWNIEPLDTQDLVSIIKTNKVYFTGGAIVASRSKWHELKRLIQNAFDMLVSFRLMDDDQTLLLMSYRAAPHLFETHAIDVAKTGWFVIFRDYNACERA